MHPQAALQRLVRAPRRALGSATASRRAVHAVRRSGLFDEAWYEEQLPPELEDRTDPVEHYVRVGAALGLSPTPLFHPAWYRERVPGAASSALGPFGHYLRRGAGRGDSPHPVFNAKRYMQRFPDAASHRGGVLGHYLQIGWRTGVEINSWFDSDDYRRRHPEASPTEPAIVDFLRRAPRLDPVGESRSAQRTFDSGLVAEHVPEGLRKPFDLRPSARPLVSVVLATRDRADLLRTAIASMLKQSYTEWELIVVDDGSTDRTPAVVESFGDRRIRLRGQAGAGAYAARNAGASIARGRYVAYLDSDNEFVERFLEIMVAALTEGAYRAGWCVAESWDRKGPLYRWAPATRSALLRSDSVDANAIVVERELLGSIGGWDESLERGGAMDLALRLTGATDTAFVPFVGVRGPNDADLEDRIVVRGPAGDIGRVRAKHLLPQWSSAEARPPTLNTSVVVVAAGAPQDVATCLDGLGRSASVDAPDEIVVVDDTGRLDHSYWLVDLVERTPTARLLHAAQPLGRQLAANLGVLSAQGEVVVLLDPAIDPQSDWLVPLVAAIREVGATAAQPRILEPSGQVLSTGWAVPASGVPYGALRGFAEHSPEVERAAERRALNGRCLAIDRRSFLDADGFDARYLEAYADIDLSWRLGAGSAASSLHYQAASVVVSRPTSQLEHDPDRLEQDRRAFDRRWRPWELANEASLLDAHDVRASAHRFVADAEGIGRPAHLPILERIADRRRPRRWAIKIGAPNVGVRFRWGDWHFAMGLREALRALGDEAVVDLYEAWYRDSASLDDAVVVLRGRERYQPDPNQHNLMWVISHPDLIDDTEYAPYDRVLVASVPYARKLGNRLGTPVEPMLQCTEPSRFRLDEDEAAETEVLFVGNSRGRLRPIVRDALAAGVDLTLYGAHWRKLVPPEVVAGDHIPNEHLPRAYRTAGVVLNDHWSDMRRDGFLSNRLFDLAACGANVVSDAVEGIDEVFEGLVRTYDDPDQLGPVIAAALERRGEERDRRRELAARIAEEHSFAARAKRLVQVVEGLEEQRQRCLDAES
jgi:GT2 family glycosyltransferase